jgi:4-amino-4-deoxy-L-arabinose transferase-like glycosyltransferase
VVEFEAANERDMLRPTVPTWILAVPLAARLPTAQRPTIARSPTRVRALTVLPLVLILALAAFLALWRLDIASWHTDELIYREAGHRYLRGDYDYNRSHPLLAKQLLGISTAVLGDGPWGVRLLPALLGLVTGILLVALGTRLGGFPVGVAAGTIWWLLPQAPLGLVGRLDRYGMLEPPALCLDVVALLAAWWWGTTGRPRAAVVAGVAVGLAASAKLVGGLILPAVLLPVFWISRPLRVRAAQAAAVLVAAALGFLVPYLVSGDGWTELLADAVVRQQVHVGQGHDMLVAGTVYQHPPWWAHLWWQQQYLGTIGVAALWTATLGLALAWRAHRRAALISAVALLIPVLVITVSPLKLPHYHLAWAAPQALAAGFGLVAAWRRGRAWRLGALAVMVALAVPAAATVRTTATLQPNDYAAAGQFLHDRQLDRSTVLVQGYPNVVRAYLPHAKLVNRPPGPAPTVILVDPVVADRQKGAPLTGYIAGLARGYQAQRFGRIVVHWTQDDASPPTRLSGQ